MLRTLAGRNVPAEAAAATYWESVDAERRAMSQEVGTWQRLRAAVSLRSLRPTRSDGEASAGEPVTRRAARLRALVDWRSRRTPD